MKTLEVHKTNDKPLFGGKFFASRLFPVALIIILLTGSVYIWKTQEIQYLNNMNEQVLAKSRSYASETELSYNKVFNDLDRLAKKYSFSDIRKQEQWLQDALYYLAATEGIDRILVVDQNLQITDAIPLAGNEKLLNQKFGEIKLEPSEISIIKEIYAGQELVGFLLSIISVDNIIKPMIAEMQDDYLIKISREGETLYQSDKWESHLEKYIHQNQITLINAEVWLLSLAPGVELYQSHIHEARQILFYTLLFSILFFGLILFAVRNNAHLRLLEERKQAEEEILEINKGLEQRIDERTAELEAVNRELESFAYSVSHDLRAPLRAINGFSEHLLAGHGDQLDKKGAHYLSRIISASLHMSELIDSLLVLSRVIRVDIKKEQFDLGELADQVVAVIQENEPKRHVKVHIEKGIPVRGDKQLLRIALENLLSNAWKFSGSSPQPEIEVGAESINNEQVFYISDNGVGFNMASVGKLFTPFQRLHSADEFPGTGIGLATVQRIINRHGGRIWAESELGHGAKFYFTLQSLPPG